MKSPLILLKALHNILSPNVIFMAHNYGIWQDCII